jgi:hypothetical protein
MKKKKGNRAMGKKKYPKVWSGWSTHGKMEEALKFGKFGMMIRSYRNVLKCRELVFGDSEAIKYYSKAIKIDPNNATYHLPLAGLMWGMEHAILLLLIIIIVIIIIIICRKVKLYVQL